MRFARIGRHVPAAAVVFGLLVMHSCTREPTASLPSVTNFISAVVWTTDTTVKGVLTAGQPPPPTSVSRF